MGQTFTFSDFKELANALNFNEEKKSRNDIVDIDNGTMVIYLKQWKELESTRENALKTAIKEILDKILNINDA